MGSPSYATAELTWALILSAMRERAPSLPEVDAGEMASLQTLGQIVDYMRDQMPDGGAAAPAAAAPSVDLEALMMDVKSKVSKRAKQMAPKTVDARSMAVKR